MASFWPKRYIAIQHKPNPLRQSSWTCALLSAERRTSPYFSFSLPSALTQRERDRERETERRYDTKTEITAEIKCSQSLIQTFAEFQENIVRMWFHRSASQYCNVWSTLHLFMSNNYPAVQILLKICHFVAINVNNSKKYYHFKLIFIGLVRIFS